jgi:hypothetical protein
MAAVSFSLSLLKTSSSSLTDWLAPPFNLLQNGLKVLDYEAFEFKINVSAEESLQQLWIGRGLGFSHGL